MRAQALFDLSGERPIPRREIDPRPVERHRGANRLGRTSAPDALERAAALLAPATGARPIGHALPLEGGGSAW